MKDYDVFAPENILEKGRPYCLKSVHQKQVNKIYQIHIAQAIRRNKNSFIWIVQIWHPALNKAQYLGRFIIDSDVNIRNNDQQTCLH